MVKEYCPDRGDVVWLEFDPQRGREIQKKRPAVVISPHTYNIKTSLALFMPITSHVKGYPFECVLEIPDQITGAVLCDQIRSLDWRARQARYITHIPTDLWQEIIEKFITLID